MPSIEKYLDERIVHLKETHAFRQLKTESDLIDFSSNDYLGLSRSADIKQLLATELEKYPHHLTGSTGSRLISGNTAYAEALEDQLANFHNAEAGLLYNSGYDANLGFFSCIPQKGDTIILDEKIHACIIDGSRLSYANRFKFRHNDLDSLEKKLKVAKGKIFIGIESVYSMDGDTPDLLGIVALAEKYNANIIIDEAHSAGVLGEKGKGLVSALGIENKIFARIHTFGKAIGSHGAVVLGSKALRSYLINTSRSFIFTTAAPFHSLASIKVAYDYLERHPELQKHLIHKIDLFKYLLRKDINLINSNTSIQSIVITGNEEVMQAGAHLKAKGFSLGVVRAPAVAEGAERLRVCLHLYNSVEEINELAKEINQYL